MKYLNTLLKSNEIDADIKEDVINSYKRIKDKFTETKIVMDENAEFIFSNHILALLKRIKSKSFVEDIDESMMEEVSQEAMKIATNLVAETFKKEELPLNQSEVFLVATHIEIAIQNQK